MPDNLINLEDESAPPVAPPQAPPAAPPEPEPPPVEPPTDDDPDALDIQGQQVVPVGVVKNLRGKLRDANAVLAQVPTLQQQIAQLQGQVQTFQSLQQTLQQPPAPQGPTPDDPELVELARSLDYYKTDGTPDIARAVKHANIIQRYVTQGTQQAMQPVQQTLAQQKSQANFYNVVNQANQAGHQLDQQALWNVWQTLPAHITADPGAAATVLASFIGAQILGKPRQPAPPGRPPLVTENVGNAPPRATAPVSDATRQVLKQRGLDEKTYNESTKDFRPGRTNVLEE